MKHHQQFEVLGGFSALWVLISHLLLVSGLKIPILSWGGHAVELIVISSSIIIGLLCLKRQGSNTVCFFRGFVRSYALFLVVVVLGIATSHLFVLALGDNPFLKKLPWPVIPMTGQYGMFVLSFVAILPLVLVLAALCYRHIETPTISWGAHRRCLL